MTEIRGKNTYIVFGHDANAGVDLSRLLDFEDAIQEVAAPGLAETIKARWPVTPPLHVQVRVLAPDGTPLTDWLPMQAGLVPFTWETTPIPVTGPCRVELQGSDGVTIGDGLMVLEGGPIRITLELE